MTLFLFTKHTKENKTNYWDTLHNTAVHYFAAKIAYHSFIHSIGMCRMRRFLAVNRSFFHSSLLCTFSCHNLHQLFFHPLSPHLAIYFLVYLSVLLFPNSCIIPFWEFYFLPFSVHAQTIVIYLTLLSLL